MSSRTSDFGVFLTLFALGLFLLAMWALGMIRSAEAAVGFAVGGYALLFIAGQLIALVREFAHPKH